MQMKMLRLQVGEKVPTEGNEDPRGESKWQRLVGQGKGIKYS